MQSENPEIGEVPELIRSLGSHPTMPPLPDPDRLWVLAQIAAGEEAAAKALRMAMLRRALRYGLPSAGALWLLFAVLEAEYLSLDAWLQTIASWSADPIANVALSALAAVAVTLLTGALVFGRSLVARPLRYFGLL
jgi:hypothetical protein